MEIWVTYPSLIKHVVGLTVEMHGEVITKIPQLPHLIDNKLHILPNIELTQSSRRTDRVVRIMLLSSKSKCELALCIRQCLHKQRESVEELQVH